MFPIVALLLAGCNAKLKEGASNAPAEQTLLESSVDDSGAASIKADNNGVITGTTIEAPSGSLPAGSTLIAQEGASLVNEFNADLLGASRLDPAGPAVNVTLEPESIPTAPLTITVPLNQALGLTTTGTLDNLIILYKVKHESGKTKLGILPPPAITVDASTVTFDSRSLGAFQAVFLISDEEIAAIEIDVDTPILNKTDSIDSYITWQKPEVVTSTEFSATFAGSVDGMADLYACVIVVDRDKAEPWDFRARIGSSIRYRYLAEDDGVYQARFQCTDVAGNTSQNSPWSDGIDLQTAASNSSNPAVALLNPPPRVTGQKSLKSFVAGDGARKFKYQVVSGKECTDANWSDWLSLQAQVSADLKTDGHWTICLRGISRRDIEQTSPTAYTFFRDSTMPTAELTNLPRPIDKITTLNIAVTGDNLTHYRYKVRPSEFASCSAASGYSTPVAIDKPIANDLAKIKDGQMTLCVIGKNAFGTWQSYDNATTFSWTKDLNFNEVPTINLVNPGFSGVTAVLNSPAIINFDADDADSDAVVTLLYSSDASGCLQGTGFGWTEIGTGILDNNNVSTMSYNWTRAAAEGNGSFYICAKIDDGINAPVFAVSDGLVTWSYPAMGPTATISGEPTGTNTDSALNIDIAGADVNEYRYDLITPAGSDCSTATYGSWVAVGINITDVLVADGSWRLCVEGRDLSFNAQLIATTVTWTRDATAPTAVISGQPADPSQDTTLTVTIAGTDVNEYQYDLLSPAGADCSGASYGAWTAVATPITVGIGTDGSKRLCVIGRDVAQNAQATATTYTWTKDTAAPTATISGEPTGTNNDTTLNVDVAGTDVNEYRYDLITPQGTDCSGATWSAWTSASTNITEAPGADGTHRLCIEGRDIALNVQAVATTATWTKDTAAPTATITGDPADPSQDTTLTVTIAGADVNEYQYDLLSPAGADCSGAIFGAWTAVATPITDGIGTDGSKRLCVIGRDVAQNAQATATNVTWTKDTTAPTATISGEPTGTNNDTTLNVDIGGAGVTEYQYDLLTPIGGNCSLAVYSGWTAESVNITEAPGADGGYRLCVIVRDAANNAQTPTSRVWTKDTAAPTATISGEPTGTNNDTTLNIDVAGTDVNEYRYDLIAPQGADCSGATYGAWTPEGTNITESPGADGTYRLCIEGRDVAQNVQAGPTTATWTKDTSAPTATYSGQPADPSQDTTLNVTVAGTDVTEYRYDLLSPAGADCTGASYGAWTVVATPITDGIGPDNSKRLCIEGRDVALNAQATPTTFTWTKDTTPPTATISGEPTGTNSITNINIDIAGTDVNEYRYDLMTPAPADCTGASYGGWISESVNISGGIGADATFRLCVQGRDVALNAQTVASTVSWTKDTTAPTATISGEPTGTNNDTTLNVDIAGADVNEYRYDLLTPQGADCTSASYGSWTSASTNITEAPGADGTYRLCVEGRDATLNAQAVATTVTWTKDTAAPTATISGEPTGTNNNTTLNVDIGGTDVNEYRYDLLTPAGSNCSGATYGAWTNESINITEAPGADGSYRLCVEGRDAANNAQVAATTVTWTKDTSAPTATISGEPTGTNNATTLNVDVAGTDVNEYRYDLLSPQGADCSGASYGAWTSASTNITEAPGADGTYRLCVEGRDIATNTQAVATTATWTKDTSAPTATISGEPTGTNNDTTLNVDIGGTDVNEYRYDLITPAGADCSGASYGAWTNESTNITEAPGADGSYRLCVEGRDVALNAQAAASTVTWTKDTDAPTATYSGEPVDPSQDTALSVTVAGTDVAEYRYDLLSPAGADCTGASYGAWTAVATPITDGIGPDASKRLCIEGRDVALNAQATPTTYTWTKDTSAPTATISGEPTGTNNDTTLNVDIAGADVNEYRYDLLTPQGADCSGATYSAWTSESTNITEAPGADGSYRLCVEGRDVALNAQAVASTVIWTKDTSAPTATISGEPTGTNNDTTLNVDIAGADVNEYRYDLITPAGGDCSGASYGAWTSASTNITEAPGADGSYRLCVEGRDIAQNVQAGATTVTWTKDTSAPTATISGAPSDPSNATTLNVDIGGTDVNEFRYDLITPAGADCSGASYSAWTSASTNITEAPGADGSYRLCVEGRDVAQNAQAVATTATWSKDTAAPTATISGEPTGTNNATTLNVDIAGADVNEYRYDLITPQGADCSGATYSAWTSAGTNITEAPGADGTYRLCVEGRDIATNAQAVATTATWTKDTAAPTATYSNEPSDPSNTIILNVTIAGTDVDQYRYDLITPAGGDCSGAVYGSWTAVATPITESAGADASKRLCIEGRDVAQNVQASPTTYTWTKDTSAPTATISGEPTGTNSDTTLNVDIGGTDVSEYRYDLLTPQGASCSGAVYSAWTSASTNITESTGANGTYRLCVQGRDIALNIQAVATTVTWIKSNNPPTLANISVRQNLVNGVDAGTISFAGSGAAVTSCTPSPALPTGLALANNGNTCEITGTPTVTAPLTTYTITAQAADTSQDTATVTLIVTNPPFTTIWNTTNAGTSGATQITLPLVSSGTYNFEVNWGDGSYDTITTWNDPAKTHTFGVGGVKTVKITGALEGWGFANGGDKLKLSQITNWGPFDFGTNFDHFRGASNLTITATDTPSLTAGPTTSLAGTFYGCNALTSIPNIDSWNVSSVTSFSQMFRNTNFNDAIGSWDTSAATSMQFMFANSNFNSDISSWNVQSVTNFSYMFQNTPFNQPLTNWITSAAQFMQFMFMDTSFNQPIDHFNVSGVTDMMGMFLRDAAFNQNLNSWTVTSVTNFAQMFKDATEFNGSIGSWTPGAGINFSEMFAGATAFNQPINSWTMTTASNLSKMFLDADAFDQGLNSWDVTGVTDFREMFKSADSFNGNISSWTPTAAIDMTSMFEGAIAFNQVLNSWDVSTVQYFSKMFMNADSFNRGLAPWTPTSAIEMTSMFESADNFNGTVNGWTMTGLTRTDKMFKDAVNFDQPMSSWTLGSVTNMQGMFQGATSFNRPIQTWNVATVQDFSYMFDNANLFDFSLDSWTVSSATNFNYMFRNALSFNQDLNSWSLTA